MPLLVILILVVIAILFGIGIYNRLVTARINFKNAFAQIDVQLTRTCARCKSLPGSC